jgi:threonine/homoserine/homoserine lactone efflux protein
MFDTATLLTYIAACFVFSIVPGPSVTVVVANSLARGTVAGLLTILGTEISMLSMVFIVALGLEAVVAVIGGAFEWIKLIGAAYLIWIGWRMFNTSGKLAFGEPAPVRPGWRYVLEGALVNWSNPKTLLFLGAFLPQFVHLEAPAFPQILVLGLIVMAVATATDSVYAFLAGGARSTLTAVRVRLLSRVSGAILMAGGVWLALLRKS